MSLVTDSTPVEDPKPKEGALYQLLKIFAPAEDRPWVEASFDNGGVGYGEMKKKLFEYFLATFGDARARYDELMADPAEVDRILLAGAARAERPSPPSWTTSEARWASGRPVAPECRPHHQSQRDLVAPASPPAMQARRPRYKEQCAVVAPASPPAMERIRIGSPPS